MPLPAHNPVATKPHDIRNNIPLTKFTNPANYPMHIHREFPKMLLCSNPDPKGRQKIIPYTDTIGQPVLVMDEVDQEEFLATLDDELAADILKCTPKSAADRLEEENAVMRKMISENEALRQRAEAAEARAVAAESKAGKPAVVATPKPVAAAKPAAKPAAPKPAASGKNKPQSVPANLKAK